MNMQQVIDDYCTRYRFEPVTVEDRPVNVRRAIALGRYMEDAAILKNPGSLHVSLSYRVLANWLHVQAYWLTSHGLTVEPWPHACEPYASSADMLADLADSHLYYLQTALAGDHGENHPMLAPVAGDYGKARCLNDVFRFVHDAIGHGVYGWSFGPRGEDNAYRTHKATLPREAWLALCCETRAQNSWVNYGPHLVRADGTVPRKGDSDYVPLPARPFAPQVVCHLPSRFLED